MLRIMRFACVGAGFAILAAGCGGEPTNPGLPRKHGAAKTATPAEDFAQGAGAGMPFADLAVFFEFNSTDDDLGFQVFLDAEGWGRVQARDPNDRQVLDIEGESELKDLGITELFFESAEPSPAEVLANFPPGAYSFEGITVNHAALSGTAILSHDLPPAPVFVSPLTGEEVSPVDLVIEWNAIAGLEAYEVIVANEEAGLSMTVRLPGTVTTLTVPNEFLDADASYKSEILSIAPNGNKTITEIAFDTAP